MTTLETLDVRVTLAMNELLLKYFLVEELGVALNQMSPLKALGLDDFLACFFQKNWTAMGEEVSQAVIHILNNGCMNIIHILNNGCMNKELSLTYIALIPKITNPTCVMEF